MEFKTIIEKIILLHKLGENRERYVETRGTLIEVYKKKSEEYQTAFREYSLREAEGTLSEDEIRPHPPNLPEDRTETYDMFISMVELHLGKTLEIDNETFKSLYTDKWDFIREHIRAMTTWANSDASLVGAISAYGD